MIQFSDFYSMQDIPQVAAWRIKVASSGVAAARLGIRLKRPQTRESFRTEIPFLTYIIPQCIELLCYSPIRVHWRHATREIMGINKDLIAASSTPLVLAILAEEDSYGYAILQRVRELSGGRMEWTDGMLYPVLHRLERLGHIEARWEVAESGRRRKYYRITSQGRARLAEERAQWKAVHSTLQGLWRALSIPGPANPAASAAPLPQEA